MSDQKSIPWARIGAEGGAIIVSILIAFSIDAWWEQRKDRLEELEILKGLHNEYTQHQERLRSRLSEQATALGEAGRLLEAAATGAWAGDSHSLDTAIFYVTAAPTTDLGSGVRDALISGGRLSLLSNRTLRYQLATWDAVIEEVRDDEDMARDLAFNMVAPYFTRHGVPIASPFSTHDKIRPAIEASELPRRLRSVGDDPDAVRRLINDPEFSAIVEFRFAYLAHLGTEYTRALDAVDAILTSIDSDLASLD